MIVFAAFFTLTYNFVNFPEAFDKHEGPFTPELQEEKTMSKRKMLGNIKFIGKIEIFLFIYYDK